AGQSQFQRTGRSTAAIGSGPQQYASVERGDRRRHLMASISRRRDACRADQHTAGSNAPTSPWLSVLSERRANAHSKRWLSSNIHRILANRDFIRFGRALALARRAVRLSGLKIAASFGIEITALALGLTS